MRWKMGVLWAAWAAGCGPTSDDPITEVGVTPAACMADLEEGFPVTRARYPGVLHSLVFDGAGIWLLHSEGEDPIPDATSVSRRTCDGKELVDPVDLGVDGDVPRPTMSQLLLDGDSILLSLTYGNPLVEPLRTRLLRLDRDTGEPVAERWVERGEQGSFGAELLKQGDDLILATPFYDQTSRSLVITRLAEDLSDAETLVSLDVPASPMIPPTLGVKGSDVVMAWGERVVLDEGYSPFVLRVHPDSEDGPPAGVVREFTSNLPIHMVTERSGRTLLAWADEDGVRITEFGVWQEWPTIGDGGDEFSLTLVDGVAHLALSDTELNQSSWIGTVSEDGQFDVRYKDPTALPLVMSDVGAEGLVVGGPLRFASPAAPWVYGVPR
ncbi:MAG: hypothetical protein AB8H79_05865 [Myxococcota bacterium]